MSVKKSVSQKLDIVLSPKKASSCFNTLGINKQFDSEILLVKEKIDVIRKEGAVPVPEFKSKCPKMPNEKDDPIIRERYEEHKNAYKIARDEHDEKEKIFAAHTSDKYKNALLAYKLKRKIEEIIKLSEPAKNPETQKTRNNRIVEVKKEIAEYCHKSWKLGYSHVVSDIVKRLDHQNDLSIALVQLNSSFPETNELFELKDKIESKKTRFGEALRYAVAFIAQEALKDIIICGIKNCHADGRTTVKREDFQYRKICKSPFITLFVDLKSFSALEDFMLRKKQFNEMKKKLDSITKEDKIKGTYVRSFEDTEISGGYAKIQDGKKVWESLNIKNRLNLSSNVYKIFDLARSCKNIKKFQVSSSAKEFLSCLLLDFLEKLNKQIGIILRKTEKKIQKTFTVDSFLMLVQLQLACADSEKISKLISDTREKLLQLKNHRDGTKLLE